MKKTRFLLIVSVLFLSSLRMIANVSLPSIFASHMVLQQNSEITIWGWGKPYEEIKIAVGWDNIEYKTVTNNQANWSIQIKTPKAGGPYDISVKGYNTIILEDILLGEVWLCSGQSNMEWSPRMGINNSEKEIAEANYPEIRFFSVVHRTASTPNYDINGSWSVCSPQTMIDFSAAAYFFARELQKELNVPIGIVNASWGGTPAEVWIPQDILNSDSILSASAQKIGEMGWSPREPGRAYNAMIAPITRYKIAGFLWYQGETNVANPETYNRLFETLIESWRDAWDEDLPFYYAQIAPFTYNESPYCAAQIRYAQAQALRLENTGMVCTSDITGDVSNIHPTNKQDLGKRFAYVALNNTYEKTQFPVSGPLYRSNKVQGNKIIVYFDYAQGLISKTKMIEGFEIAGSDGKFLPAQAKIVGTSVEVTSKQITSPTYVRFGWTNTAKPQLFNDSKLPASCFTTKE